jgi:hypothetical protein
MSDVILNPKPDDLMNLANLSHKVLSGSTQIDSTLISQHFSVKSFWLQGELRLIARYAGLKAKIYYLPKMFLLYGFRKTLTLGRSYVLARIYRLSWILVHLISITKKSNLNKNILHFLMKSQGKGSKRAVEL